MAEPIFDAPIPGNSLTKEVGSQSWKNPPQYVTLEEAVDFYLARMSTDEFTNKLITTLEMGVPVSSIVNVMQMHGVMEGQHTLDVSIMLMPILMEMVALIADTRGIEYNMGLENEESIAEADNDMVDMAVDKLSRKQFNQITQDEVGQEVVEVEEEEEDFEQPPAEPEGVEQQEEVLRGLMAREI